METMPPFQVVSGQRQLAAIMFTDAVGYSARMHEQEIATLNRIERDTETMRRMIASQSGTVLKSTGDGLLIQFSSAVQAVACALEIQRHFTVRTDPTLAASSALRYRIGVHLGDVFVGGGDVMGDGVNIAARLVNEAVPGGIVVSHTVYDVVKNKLPLHTVRLGPKKLKNIKEPVTIYKVLLEEPAAPTPVASASSATPAAASPAAPTGSTSRPTKIVLLLLGVIGLGLVTRFVLKEQVAHDAELEKSLSAHAALGKLLEKSAAKTPADPVTAGPVSPAYDFAALVTRTPADPSAAAWPAAEKSAAVLQAWLTVNLERYTKDRPLYVNGAGFQGTSLYLDASHQLYFTEGGATRRRNWSELRESAQVAIIISTLQDAPQPLPAQIREGAEAFAYLHGLPEMIAALRR